jgi:hypothetical protein
MKKIKIINNFDKIKSDIIAHGFGYDGYISDSVKWLVKCSNIYGNAVIIKVGEMPNNLKLTIPQEYFNINLKDVYDLTGAAIIRPNSLYYKKGKSEYYIDQIKILDDMCGIFPILTIEELNINKAAANKNSDISASRISELKLLNILDASEKIHKIHLGITKEYASFLKRQDDILADLIISTRKLRDTLASYVRGDIEYLEQEKNDIIDKLKFKENLINLIYSHSLKVHSHSEFLENLLKETTIMNEEMKLLEQ